MSRAIWNLQTVFANSTQEFGKNPQNFTGYSWNAAALNADDSRFCSAHLKRGRELLLIDAKDCYTQNTPDQLCEFILTENVHVNTTFIIVCKRIHFIVVFRLKQNERACYMLILVCNDDTFLHVHNTYR